MANIVHFGKYYKPDNGGIESVTLSLARGASLAGYNVTVVCFANNSSEGLEFLDGVKVLRSFAFRLIASQPVGLRYFMDCIRSAKGADLVHLHMPNMLAAFCALLIAPKVRLLVHWHSDVIDKGFLGKLLFPLQYLLLLRADVVVATSSSYVDSSFFLSHFGAKVKVIPIGIDAKKAPKLLIRLPEKLDIFINENKVILAIGRLVPYKGFEFLILAAKNLVPDARLVIVGDGPLRMSLEALIKDSFLEDRVMLAGRLDDHQLNLLLHRASVYCMTSINKAEAFGVVMLEAMSCGLPVVATNIVGSGVPWVNQHGYSGLNVAIKDSKSLAQACNQILRSESLRSQFSQGAKQRFYNEFTADIAIYRTLNLYNSLLDPEISSYDSAL